VSSAALPRDTAGADPAGSTLVSLCIAFSQLDATGLGGERCCEHRSMSRRGHLLAEATYLPSLTTTAVASVRPEAPPRNLCVQVCCTYKYSDRIAHVKL
jgi:hypothetical protein